MAAPFLIAVFILLWKLRKSHRLNIRLAGGLIGIQGFIIAFAAGVEAGVTASTSFVVGVIAWILSGSIVIGLVVLSNSFVKDKSSRLRW